MGQYTYQIQRSPDGVGSWSDLSGQSGTINQAEPFSQDINYLIQSADETDYLRLKVTDPFGTIKYSVVLGPVGAELPPAPGSGARDDKRAVLINSLSSTGWSYSNPSPGVHNLTQSLSPGPLGTMAGHQYSFLNFTNNDITLEADSRFTKVARVKCGSVSHNPFFDHIYAAGNDFYVTHNSNLQTQRPTYTDQGSNSEGSGALSWDWYYFALKYESGYTFPSAFGQQMEVAYPVLWSPPFELGLYGDGGIRADRMAGYVVPDHSADINQFSSNFRMFSDVVDKWLEFIVGIYWSSHNNGKVIVKTRCKDLGESGWTTGWNLSGTNTWQWGTRRGGTSSVPQDVNGYTSNDIFGIYEGWGTSIHADNFPINYCKHSLWVRCADEATALSYAPT